MSDSPWKSFPAHVPDPDQDVDVRRLGFIPDEAIRCSWSLASFTFFVIDTGGPMDGAELPWWAVTSWAPHI